MKKNRDHGGCKFWKNIAYLRKQLGFTQDKMANELNVSRSRLSSWEENRAKPWLMTLVRVSQYFGLSMEEMVVQDLEKEAQEKSFTILKKTA